MEWKKIVGMEYGKIVFHSIPLHALLLYTGAQFSVFKDELTNGAVKTRNHFSPRKGSLPTKCGRQTVLWNFKTLTMFVLVLST